MTPEDVARLFADEKPGYELVSYGEVALPVYRLSLSALTLEKKAIPPVSEFVLRSVAAGVDAPREIQTMLGLTGTMVDATVVELVHHEYLRLSAPSGSGSGLVLTEKGRQGVEEAIQIVPERRNAELDFDALLGEPVAFVPEFLEPKDVKEERLREVPPPATFARPEIADLDVASLQRLGRIFGRPQGASTTDVLALQKITYRKRIFRRAVALVYTGTAGEDPQVAFAVDGALSRPHEEAFARAGLTAQFGIDPTDGLQPAEAAAANVFGRELIASWDREEEAKLRNAIRDAERAEVAETEGMPVETSPGVLPAGEAREALESLTVRFIETYDHPKYLERALESSQKRLVVLSPWLRGQVIDDDFIGQMGRRLRDGAHVYMGWGFGSKDDAARDADPKVLQKLMRLEQAQSNFCLRHLEGTHSKILLCDQDFVVVTSFNWLSFRGDPKRTFRDERGVLVRDPAKIDEEFERLVERFAFGSTTAELNLKADDE